MNSTLIDNKVQESGSGHFEPDLDLLDLPYVTLHRIMEFMDPSALKTLRRVSRAIKFLVETPKILQKIKIEIPNPEQLEEIKNSEVEWNNIGISIERQWSDDMTTLIEFLQSRRNTLKRLSLKLMYYREGPKEVVKFLVNMGPNLKYLVIDGPLMTMPNDDGRRRTNEFKILLDESREILERNFSGLRRVQFKRGFGQGLLICLIDTFLKCCSDSISINIPMVSISNDADMSNEEKAFKCAPLISYLERMSKLNGIRPLSIIDFWAGTTRTTRSPYHYNFYNIPEYISPFPLTRSVLTKLAILCEQNRVQLVNVPSSALPKSHVLTSKEKKCFDKCIESIVCLNDPTGIRGYIPQSCVVQVIVSFYGKDFSSFNIPDTANVTSIFIDGGTREYNHDIGSINEDIMLYNLLQVFRPKVTELVLRGCFLGVELKIGQFLPNLISLTLVSLKREQQFQDLLNGLDKLQYLKLKDCHFKNSTGPSSDNWFPVTKNLKDMKIEGCTFDLKFTSMN